MPVPIGSRAGASASDQAARPSRPCAARASAFLGGDHDVDVVDPPSALGDPRRDVAQQDERVGVAVGVVARGKQRPEVGQPRRAEQGVGDGVRDRVAVGVAGEARRVLDPNATEHERRRVAEGMDVEAEPDAVPHGPSPVSRSACASSRSPATVSFRLRVSPGTITTVPPRGLDQRGVVGVDRRPGVRGAQHRGAERLRGLHDDQIGPRHGVEHPDAVDPLHRVDDRQRGDRGVGAGFDGGDHRREQRPATRAAGPRRARRRCRCRRRRGRARPGPSPSASHRPARSPTPAGASHASVGRDHDDDTDRTRPAPNRTARSSTRRATETGELLRGAEARAAPPGNHDRPSSTRAQRTARRDAFRRLRCASVLEGCEDEPARARRHDRRDLQHDLGSADEIGPAVDDHHRSVVEVTDSLARLLAFARRARRGRSRPASRPVRSRTRAGAGCRSARLASPRCGRADRRWSAGAAAAASRARSAWRRPRRSPVLLDRARTRATILRRATSRASPCRASRGAGASRPASRRTPAPRRARSAARGDRNRGCRRARAGAAGRPSRRTSRRADRRARRTPARARAVASTDPSISSTLTLLLPRMRKPSQPMIHESETRDRDRGLRRQQQRYRQHEEHGHGRAGDRAEGAGDDLRGRHRRRRVARRRRARGRGAGRAFPRRRNPRGSRSSPRPLLTRCRGRARPRTRPPCRGARRTGGHPLRTRPSHRRARQPLEPAARSAPGSSRRSDAGAGREPVASLATARETRSVRDRCSTKPTSSAHCPLSCSNSSAIAPTLVKYRRGDCIFTKGDAADPAVRRLSGRIAITAASSDDRESVISVLGPGALFGEMPLFDGGTRSATARA